MTERVAIYARYSSDLQRERSLDDQVRLCRDYADRQGWRVTHVFSDAAVSGSSLNRKGYWDMVATVREQRVTIVLAEAVDRLSRDQEDLHYLYKVLCFNDVRLFTCDTGENTAMHLGLKGIVVEQHTTDLANKVRRGQAGRVREGKSGGGHCYGYDVVRAFDADGKPVTGLLSINEEQAAIVRRIFREYADGGSPKRIVKRLNQEGIPSPRKKEWNVSTLLGNTEMGDGMLNNSLYIGWRVWNRRRTVKNPDTRNRTFRRNASEDRVVGEAPELRLIDDELWKRVKKRQEETRSKYNGMVDKAAASRARRPKFLLSGLIKCGVCGGNYVCGGRNRWRCANFAERGRCTNCRSIARQEIEDRVFGGLRNKLLQRPLLKAFIKGWNAELGKRQSQAGTRRKALEKELATVEKGMENVLTAVEAGKARDYLMERLEKLGGRRDEIRAELAETQEALPPKLKASMVDLYAEKAANIVDTLTQMRDETAMREAIRQLIEKVVIRPTPGRERLEMDLHGRIAGMFTLEAVKREGEPHVQIAPIAGVGFEPTTFRL